MISLYKFPDVFDECAKNEAACVQALHHLIAKADSEIDDLKDELAVVQCQRKWAESGKHTNFFEVCCAAFKQRIDSLTSTIQRSRNGLDTVSDIQRPSENICDIIDALIKADFTELDEQSQEGDIGSEKAQVVSCGSLNIYTEVRQQATTLESSMESEKQPPVPEKLDKPTQSLSEESCSDAARHSPTDMTEVISMALTDVKVFEQLENAEHASKEKTVFSTKIEPVTSQCPFQASNDEGNLKPTGLQCGEIESCMCGSKAVEAKSPILVAKTEVIIKVEQNVHDTKIQRDSAVEDDLMALENQSQSVSDLGITHGKKKSNPDTSIQCDLAVEDCVMTLENQSHSLSDQEIITYARKKSYDNTIIKHDSAIEGKLMALENQSQSISHLEITSGRKRPSLSRILKPPGKKARKKILDDVRTFTPSQKLVPKKTITKRKYSSIKSPLSSEIDESFRFLPESNWQRKVETKENADLVIPLQVSQAKKHQPKGAEVDFPDILSPEVNVSEGSLDTKLSMTPNSSGGITVRLKSANPVEVKETVITSFADTLTLGRNNPTVENTETKIPEFDLESLKERRSEPDFLKNLTALQLRKIAKLVNMRGYSKIKKDKLIEGLCKYLAKL